MPKRMNAQSSAEKKPIVRKNNLSQTSKHLKPQNSEDWLQKAEPNIKNFEEEFIQNLSDSLANMLVFKGGSKQAEAGEEPHKGLDDVVEQAVLSEESGSDSEGEVEVDPEEAEKCINSHEETK